MRIWKIKLGVRAARPSFRRACEPADLGETVVRSGTESTVRGRGAYHKQYEHVDDGHARVDEHGQPPVGGEGVRDGEQERAHVVEHVGDGREGAAQVGLAHLADVRGARAARGPDAQAHQHGRGVQSRHAVRVEQRGHGHEVRPVGQHHAHVVPQAGHERGRQHAAHRREQEQQAAWNEPTATVICTGARGRGRRRADAPCLRQQSDGGVAGRVSRKSDVRNDFCSVR